MLLICNIVIVIYDFFSVSFEDVCRAVISKSVRREAINKRLSELRRAQLKILIAVFANFPSATHKANVL